jgi:hypothetical protein
MSVPYMIHVPAFDLRLYAVGHTGRREPYALGVGAADGNRVSEVAAGSRPEMRDLRNRLLIALRSDPDTLDAVASALAKLAQRLPPDPL